MKKSCAKMYQKLVPDHFWISVKTQNNHCIQEIILKIRYFERGLFQIQSLLMDKIIKDKRGLELMSSYSSSYKTSPENFFY